MSDIEAFKTRAKANDGVKVPLSTPDGAPTEHWLQIRSIWSDEYQAARSELIRQAIDDGRKVSEAKGEAATLRKTLDRKRRAVAAASLIAGWSFDLEFTEEAVADFLLEAPQILAHVERIAEDGARFFGKGSIS